MKKIFTSMVVALMMMAAPAQAQLSYGIMGGLNMTKMSYSEDVVNESDKTGFFIGPTINFTIPVVGLGIDASALYDQRESKIGEETIKTQTIQIPVNLRYGIGLGDMASVFVFAGPQFGFKVGGDKTLAEEANVAKEEWTMKSSNLSLNLGLGAMALSHLQVKINYNIALGKTGEFEYTDVVTNTKKVTGDAKANSWQVSLAYLF
jgi:opacity protein-like surface antigen